MTDQSKFPEMLTAHYKLAEKIGEGGFAKVRVAKHKLTGEKVAIKIMDKAALRKTNDLPRVKLEIQALKDLNHHNISRLYYAHETETQFYLVLEYAPGGELFDHIVARQRCKEDEARRFFRQICAAVAYCHDAGIAHRDLKPENLMLDKQMNIKLIDFGLIARPSDLQHDLLKTCCGSAAYAAPELIRGEKYLGKAADMWSLGILLYALLVGWLPFDDDDMPKLYRMIQKGSYEIPPFLSNESVKLIGQLLKHKPDSRLKMADLLKHPWLLKGTSLTVIDKASQYPDKNAVDRVVCAELAKFYSVDVPTIEALILEWNYDSLTANYCMLCTKKRNGGNIRLPAGKHNVPADVALALMRQQEAQQQLGSQGSLDGITSSLERLPLDGSAVRSTSAGVTDKEAVAMIMNRGGGRRSATISVPSTTGGGGGGGGGGGMANELPPIVPLSQQMRSQSLGATPDTDLTQVGLDGSPLDMDGTGPASSGLKPKHKADIEYRSAAGGLNTLGTGPVRKRRTGFQTLIGSIGNMFGSRDQLTPRKLKGNFNVSTTSTKDATVVLAEIERVLLANGYDMRKKAFLCKARKFDAAGKQIAINFEVCQTANLDLTGIRLARVKGDTWEYKKETERLLGQMRL